MTDNITSFKRTYYQHKFERKNTNIGTFYLYKAFENDKQRWKYPRSAINVDDCPFYLEFEVINYFYHIHVE